MSTTLRPFALAISTLISAPAIAEELQPIVINADLRQTTEQDIAASVDVKTQAELQDQGATHFDDVLLKTPNVNFSGQSSRARYIQIRGMGERDEYTGAPNSSVGFSIDDVDYSGTGMAASTFDVKQIEILRGPQNTRYGRSSIAGLINVKSNDPTPYQESMAEITGGQDNLREIGIMTSGPFSSKEDAPQYRVAIFKHSNDGFIDNKTLNRSDTNGRDELTARAKLRFFPSNDTTIDLTLLHSDLNNGYDAFSRDNSFTTLSNEPGKDTLLSNSGSLKITSQINSKYQLQSITSFSDNELSYQFDADWKGDDDLYRGIFDNNKERQNFSQDFRILADNWLIGAYFSKFNESNKRFEIYDYPTSGVGGNRNYYQTETVNDYELQKASLYGEYTFEINSKASIKASLRAEKNSKDFSITARQSGIYYDDNGTQTDYSDDSNQAYDYNTLEDFSPDETLWGGSLIYSYKYNKSHTAFTSVTRGYKMGGFNINVPEDANESVNFDSETVYNYEIGLHSNYFDGDLKTSTTLFYMDRKNPQFDGYGYDSTGVNYIFFTENFDSATSKGLETDFDWKLSTNWSVFGALSLMQTEAQSNPTFTSFTVDGREYAHAPSHQFNIGAKYRNSSGYYAMAEATSVDSFYFDNVHDFKSDPYTLINARIGYEAEDFEVYLWGKNITDESYATRGYKFDHFDGDGEQEYVRLGDPRQFGVTARVYF